MSKQTTAGAGKTEKQHHQAVEDQEPYDVGQHRSGKPSAGAVYDRVSGDAGGSEQSKTDHAGMDLARIGPATQGEHQQSGSKSDDAGPPHDPQLLAQPDCGHSRGKKWGRATRKRIDEA